MPYSDPFKLSTWIRGTTRNRARPDNPSIYCGLPDEDHDPYCPLISEGFVTQAHQDDFTAQVLAGGFKDGYENVKAKFQAERKVIKRLNEKEIGGFLRFLRLGRASFLSQLSEPENQAVAIGLDDLDREERLVYEQVAAEHRDWALASMGPMNELRTWEERTEYPVIGHMFRPMLWWKFRKTEKQRKESLALQNELIEAWNLSESVHDEIDENEQWKVDIGDQVTVPVYRNSESRELLYTDIENLV